jgi:hypothetical protein
LKAETWVGENISSGGGYSAEGAELRLYGTEGARTLEIVATGLALDTITEPPNRDAPRNRNRDGA